MRRTWTVALLRHEQPTQDTWEELEELVLAWNAGPGPRFDTSIPFLRQAVFDEHERPALDRLLAALDRVDDAAVHVAGREALEDEDYERADLVGLLGADPGAGFVLNEPAALSDAGPCETCGEHDAFDVVQNTAFVVDESRLDTGVEIVNLPGGGLALAPRLLDAWEAAGVVGLERRALVSAATSAPSPLLAQVTAQRSLLTPCPEHTVVTGAAHCPGCGRARGDLVGYFWVRSDEVGDHDVVARHPGRRAMLFVSRRARATLQERVTGRLVLHDVIRVCAHPGAAGATP